MIIIGSLILVFWFRREKAISLEKKNVRILVHSIQLENNDLEGIEIKERLGGGNFGDVYRGIWDGTAEIALEELKNSSQMESFEHEAYVL